MKAKTLIGLTATLAAVVVLLGSRWSAGRAEPVASITLPPPGAAKQLYPGCNNVGLTFPDGTSSSAVIEAVNPPGSVLTMWRHDAAQRRWEAFSAAAPAASDLATVNFLNAVWLCFAGGSPTPAPTAATPAGQPGQTATPTSATTTPTASAGQTATPSSTTTTPTVPAGQSATPTPGSQPSGRVTSAVPPTDVLTSFRYSMETSIEADSEMAFTITSSGSFKGPDRFSCALTASAAGTTFDMGKMVVIPPDAWVNMGSGWAHTQDSDPSVVGNLGFCPGSSFFWESLELPADLGSIQGQLVTINGVAAVRLSLVGRTQTVPSFGVIPPGLEDATIHTFDIWVAQDGGWLAALALDATVFGETEDDSGGTTQAQIQMRIDVTNPNDASIQVVPPM